MNSINVEHDINIHLENKGVSRRFFMYIFIVYTFVCMTKNCFNGALADIVQEGVLTKSQTGLITALFYIVYTPLQIVGGIAADKFSPERMLKIGLVGAAIANTVIFFNQSYYVMLITWTLNGAVQFALWPSVYKIISSQLCRSDISYMVLLITLSTSIGLFVSYAAAAAFSSWEYNFAFSAAGLFIGALGLHIYDRRIAKYMKPDYEPIKPIVTSENNSKHSTISLFFKSGFLLLLIPIVAFTTVSQSSKTLFPVMLVETHAQSSTFGNLLNVLVALAAIIGVLLFKFVLYPKIIKNEIVGMLVMMAIASLLILILIYTTALSVTVIAFCALSLITAIPLLLVVYFNSSFIKYGKNGTAAGISNSAASLAYAISSYGIAKVAELYDWQAVKIVWLILSVLAVVLLATVYFINKRFKRKENAGNTQP